MTYDLTKYKKAQYEDFETALREITNGKKRSHWIWYIFPQLKSLGISEFSIYYGIENSKEAKEYIEDEMLRNNLVQISEALLQHKDKELE